MTASSLTLTLTPEPHPDSFTLSWGMKSYPIEFRPQEDATLGDLLHRLYPLLVGERQFSVEHPHYELLRAVGSRLWQAFLPSSAPAEKREELERKLRMDKMPLLLMLPPSLFELPWELLCDPQQAGKVGFLTLQRSLVRLIPGGFNVPSFMPPLRVQVLISSSPNLNERQQIDVESERAAINNAVYGIREAGLLHLQVEDIVTPRRVQQALLRFKPHILHYIGHGGYNEDMGSYLVWEDDHGEPMPIPDTRLADLLRPRGLRGVLLQCCQTASSNTHNEFRNMAKTLIDAGIPAVLTQRACFGYPSNQRASEIFYTALTSGMGLGEAIFEVRQALAQTDGLDWALPILQATTYGLAPLLNAKAPPSIPDPALTRNGVIKNLPAPLSVFVGRQRELRALRAMLNSAPGSGPVMALITGPGGVGKSALVEQAVIRYGENYKDGLTLNFANYQGFELILQRIGEFLMHQGAPELLEHLLPDPKLNIEIKIHETIEAMNRAGPFLLLMDNLENVQQKDRTLADPDLFLLLQGLLTSLRGGRVLITGRYALEGLLLPDKFTANFIRLDLNDLNYFETQQLLIRHPALAHLSDTIQAELVHEFGGLPYVYDLLSSKAAGQNLDVLINDVQGRITHERQEHTASEWKQVRQQVIEFTALDTTIARLPEQARTLLTHLSVFRRPIPVQALEQGLGATQTDWQALVDWALLHYNPVDGNYQLHSLVARYAEGLLNEAERAGSQVQAADWYLHYANSESHDVADYLEAHRLLREGGNALRASELAINLANALMRSGLYQLVRNLCVATIKDASASNDHQVRIVSEAQYLLGKVAQSQGEYEEARRLYSESLAIKEQLGDQSGRAATLLQLGNIAQSQGEYEEARRLYSESLAIKEQLGDQSGRAATLLQLGNIAQSQGEYEEARRLYSESLAIKEQLGDQSGRAATLLQLGNIAQSQGEYEEARRLYSESLAITEQLGDQSGRAATLHQLGIIAQSQGEYEEARRLYSESLAIKERHGDIRGLSATLYQLGIIAQSQGEYEEARRLYSESLAITEQLGDQSGRAATLHQLGIIAQSQGEYEEARRLYSESLAIIKRLGDQSGRAATLHQLGIIAQSQGEYEEARRLYSEALEIFERLGDPRGRAATLGELGLLARQHGDYVAALDYMAQALMIFEHLRLPPRYLALRTIAELRAEMGEVTFVSLWEKATQGRPLPDLPTVNLQQGLPQILITLIQAKDWAELQSTVEAHSNLISAEADAILDELAMVQQNEDTRGRIEQIRALLARCREVGIAAAFAEMPIWEGQQADIDFTDQRGSEIDITSDSTAGSSFEEEKVSTAETQPPKEEVEQLDYQPVDKLSKHVSFRCAHCGKETKIVLNLRESDSLARKKSQKIQMLRYCEHCNRPNIIEISDIWDSTIDTALLL